MLWMLLFVALGATGETADTASAPVDTAVPAADTAAVAVDTGPSSAALLRGEVGGLGCATRGGHPAGLGALGLLVLLLRRKDDG